MVTVSSVRRKFKRCTVNIPLKMTNDHSSVDSQTVNISIDGVFAKSKKSFPINSIVFLTLSIPKEESFEIEKVSIIGEVLRIQKRPSINEYPVGMGIEFKTIKDADMGILRGFLLKRLVAENMIKKKAKNKSDKDDIKKTQFYDLEVNGSPSDTSMMNFIDSLNIHKGKSNFSEIAFKWAFKISGIIFLLYICYCILLHIIEPM